MQHHDSDEGGFILKLQEISNYKDNLPEALARAKADVPVAEAELKAAEGRLAAAETERQRANQNFGRLNGNIPVLREKYRAAKMRAMALESEADGRDTQSGWQAYTRLRREHQQAVDTLAWFSVFPMEDVAMNYLDAEIAERVAAASLFEAQACRARCSVLIATMDAQKYDPGIQLDASASWSNSESAKANEIMTRTVPSLREQLAGHRAQVEAQRAGMDVSIWN
jgi:hypothetical protein